MRVQRKEGPISFLAVKFGGMGAGHSFGFSSGVLAWDSVFGDAPGVFTPISSFVISGETVASAFGTNLDAGPVVLWTHGETGDTISVGLAAVPEPSSVVLLGFGSLSVLFRRRR